MTTQPWIGTLKRRGFRSYRILRYKAGTLTLQGEFTVSESKLREVLATDRTVDLEPSKRLGRTLARERNELIEAIL